MDIKYRRILSMIKKTVCWNCGIEVPKVNYKINKEVTYCAKCHAPYPEKPRMEAKLSILQDKLFSLRDKLKAMESRELDNSEKEVYTALKSDYQKNIDKMFYMLHELTFNIICSKLRGSAMRLNKEEIEDMVQWSLIKVLSYYNTKPNFKITGSFTGYMSMVVLYPLYNQKKKLKNQTEISIDTPLSRHTSNDEPDTQTLLDRLSQKEDKSVGDVGIGVLQSKCMIREILAFMETTMNKIFITRESNKWKDSFSFVALLLITYYHFFSQKSDRFFTEYWKTSTLELQDTFQGTLTILRNSLKGGYL